MPRFIILLVSSLAQLFVAEATHGAPIYPLSLLRYLWLVSTASLRTRTATPSK